MAIIDNRRMTLVVEPIGQGLQQQVVAATEDFIVRAEALFGRDFERVPVLFDLRGSAAGMFKVAGRRRWIRYNPWIFSKYFDENLRDTVPHEVAHYIVHELYGSRRVKPHGRQWRSLMRQFGADAGVTFDLDLAGIPRRRQRTHAYICGCREHWLSSTRHNRVVRGTGRYHCVSCGGELTCADQTSISSSTPL
jgi:SprT protein